MQHIKINARLLRSDGTTLTAGTTVNLLDYDLFEDDLLASSVVGDNGEISFMFSAAELASLDDAFFESSPDVYVFVTNGPNKGFKSKPIHDLSVLLQNPVTGFTDTTHELGDLIVQENIK